MQGERIDPAQNARVRYAVLLLHQGGPADRGYVAQWQYLERQMLSRRTMDLLPQLIWQTIVYAVLLPWRLTREMEVQKSRWVTPTRLSPRLKESEMRHNRASNPDAGYALSIFYMQLLAKYLQLRLEARVQQVAQSLSTSAEGVQENLSPNNKLIAVAVKHASFYQPNAVAEALASLQFRGNYTGLEDSAGNPAIVEEEHLIVLPLYPQYNSLYTGAALDAVFASSYFRERRTVPHLHFIRSYCEHPAYIRGLEMQVREFFFEHGAPGHLLLAFNGLPQRFTSTGDCYAAECYRTFQVLQSVLSQPFDTDEVEEDLATTTTLSSTEGWTPRSARRGVYRDAFPGENIHISFLPYGVEASLEPRTERVVNEIAAANMAKAVKEVLYADGQTDAQAHEDNEKGNNAHCAGPSGVVHILCPGMVIDEVKTTLFVNDKLSHYIYKKHFDEVLFIPSLNDSVKHAESLADLLIDHIKL